MKLELANGTIIKICGTLYRARLGGVSTLCKLVSPGAPSSRREGNASKEDFDSVDFQYKQVDSTECYKWMESTKVLDLIADLGRRLSKCALRHLLIRRHLAIDLRKMDMVHAKIEAEINGETLHPSHGIACPFDGNDRDGKNMLVQGKDFLSSCSGCGHR